MYAIKQYTYSDNFDINTVWGKLHPIMINVKSGMVFKCAEPTCMRLNYTTCIYGAIDNVTLTMLTKYFGIIVISDTKLTTSEYHSTFALYICPQPNIVITDNTIVRVDVCNTVCLATMRCKYMYSKIWTVLSRAYKNPKIYYVDGEYKTCNAEYARVCISEFISSVLPAISVIRGKYRVSKFVVIEIIKLAIPDYMVFRNNKLCWIWD